MSSTATATHVQRLLAENVLHAAVALLQLPPVRSQQRSGAITLRQECRRALAIYALQGVPTPTVVDEVTVGWEAVGAPFIPDARDLVQITCELHDALTADEVAVGYLADDVAWLGHLAHLHLVRADLASGG